MWALVDVLLAEAFSRSVYGGLAVWLGASIAMIVWFLWFAERPVRGALAEPDDRPWLFLAWPLFVLVAAWAWWRADDDDEPPAGECEVRA